jgi:hypothetical protein
MVAVLSPLRIPILDWSDGDQEALGQLMPLVYNELRRVAKQYMRYERPGHRLQPTALVHEVYLQLIDQTRVKWQRCPTPPPLAAPPATIPRVRYFVSLWPPGLHRCGVSPPWHDELFKQSLIGHDDGVAHHTLHENRP